MKVVAFNGSPRKQGNTYEALKLVANELEFQGIEVEIVHIGNKDIQSCTSCNSCFKNRNEACIINDEVNEWIQKMKNADGIILGSPVHFSAMSAKMKTFLDRAFFVGDANKSLFRHKVGASVVAVRRAGGVPVFNQLNNYLQYAEMFLPSSNYWNVIYGLKLGQALEDEEGMQIMRVLGKNMAYLMKLIEFGKESIETPEFERKIYTNLVK